MSNYFKNIEDKYNPLLSFKNPVIVKAQIKLDKDDVRINSRDIRDVDFTIRKIARDISIKYNCLTFSTFNEINIVLDNPEDLKKKGKLETHDVVSLFSQEIFMRYNDLSFSKKRNFVSVNAFNVFEDKIKSYLYSRQSVGFNNYVALLGSKLFSYNQTINKNREEILDILETIRPSLKSVRAYLKEGYTTSNGTELSLHDIGSINDLKNINFEDKQNSFISFSEDLEEDI